MESMNGTRIVALLFIFSIAAACDRADNGGDALARQVARALPRVEEGVGLKFKTPPKVEARSRAQVREFVEREFSEQQPAAQLQGEEAAAKVLGLIPENMDLRAFILELLTEQIAGYYDPSTEVLYVVEGQDRTITDVTVLHELVHALQDQYVDLDSIKKLHGNSDRALAAAAVIEGQATYEQLSMMTGGSFNPAALGGWEAVRDQIRQSSAQMPVFSRAPTYIQETVLFPYLSGAEFARRFEESGRQGSVLDAMPLSSEQVMHREAYERTPRDAPTDVTLPAPNGVTRLHDDVMGEFGTRIFLYEHLRDQASAIRGAAGWDGDRYVVFRTTGGTGLAWLSIWDTALDAGEFADILKRTVNRRYGVDREREVRGATDIDAGKRLVRVGGGEIAGRAYVLYVDVPAGASRDVIDVSRVRLGP